MSATLGAPLAAPTWFLPGGGITDEREVYVTLFNASPDTVVRADVSAMVDGQQRVLPGLQGLEVPAGGRRTVRLSEHVDEAEVLPLVIDADGPVVVERALYRVGGRGASQSMGIPLAVDVFVPDPIEG